MPRRLRTFRVGPMLTLGGVLLCSSGCSRTRVESSLAGVVAAGDVNAELDFWDALATRPVVSNDEGLHGMFLFVDKADPSSTYEQRLAMARARGWVEESWNEPWDLAMQRGILARVIAMHCKIEGGVMMQLLGPVPRYATRELQYLGMMGSGSEQQALSGREYMGVLSKAQDYLLLQQAQKEAEQAAQEASPEPAPVPAKAAAPAPQAKREPPVYPPAPPGKRQFTP